MVQHVAQSLNSFDPPDCLAVGVGAWQPHAAPEGPYLHTHTAASRASWVMHEHDMARGTASARAAMRKAVSRVARVSPGGDVSNYNAPLEIDASTTPMLHRVIYPARAYQHDKEAGKGALGKPGSGDNAGADAGAAAGKAVTDEDARLAALRQRQAALTSLAKKMARDAMQLSIPLPPPVPPAPAP